MMIGDLVVLALYKPGLKPKVGMTGRIVNLEEEFVWVEFNVQKEDGRRVCFCQRFKKGELASVKSEVLYGSTLMRQNGRNF